MGLGASGLWMKAFLTILCLFGGDGWIPGMSCGVGSLGSRVVASSEVISSKKQNGKRTPKAQPTTDCNLEAQISSL